MSTDILMETSADSMESVFCGLHPQEKSLVCSKPVDKIKLKLRRQDGLIYLLSGTVDQKKKLLHSAQEMIAQLTSELNRKDDVVQQLKEEIGSLKTDRRGSNGKIHLLQYQLNRSAKTSLDLIENGSFIHEAPVQQPKSVVPESPLTNRQAWLMHWRNSQNFRNSLVSGVTDPVQTAGTNTSICIEAVELDRSIVAGEDLHDPCVTPVKETSRIVDPEDALSCTAMLSNAIAEAPSSFMGSFDLSQFELRMREYVDAQLQMKLLNMTSTSLLPGGTLSSPASASAPSVVSTAVKSPMVLSEPAAMISPIATDMSDVILGGDYSTQSGNRGGTGSGKSFILTTEKKSAPASAARVHFSYVNEVLSPAHSMAVDQHDRSSSSASSVSTTEYNEESRQNMSSRSPTLVPNKTRSTGKSTVDKHQNPTSLMVSDDSESTVHTTLNITEIMNKSSVSPSVIRSLFTGFLGEDRAATDATPIVVGRVSVQNSATQNRSVKSADKSLKSNVNSLVTVQLTPDSAAVMNSPVKSTNRNGTKSARPSTGRTLASAVSRHSVLSVMTTDESTSHSPLKPTGFDFHEQSDIMASRTSKSGKRSLRTDDVSTIMVNRLDDDDADSEDEEGSVLTCYTLNSGESGSDLMTSASSSHFNGQSSGRLIIPLGPTSAVSAGASGPSVAGGGFKTPKAYRILPPSPVAAPVQTSPVKTVKSSAKRGVLRDITNTTESPVINSNNMKKAVQPTPSGNDVDRLSTKDLIKCISGSGGKVSQRPPVSTQQGSHSSSFSSPQKKQSVAVIAAVASPEVVAATPPSKVLQFLKAQAKRLNQSTAPSASEATIDVAVKPTVSSPDKSSSTLQSAPLTEVIKSAPMSSQVVVSAPTESVQDVHAFYQQQLQIQQQNMMNFFMQQMQKFAPAPVVPSIQSIVKPHEAPLEVVSEPSMIERIVPSKSTTGSAATAAAASSLLSPDSFRDHMSKFRRENDKIRSDINRFKGTIEKMKDECQPYIPTRSHSMVPSSGRYSGSTHSSVYM